MGPAGSENAPVAKFCESINGRNILIGSAPLATQINLLDGGNYLRCRITNNFTAEVLFFIIRTLRLIRAM